MNISDWLRQAEGLLSESGITTARLDCLVLLEDAIDQNRSWILAHPETPLSIHTMNLLQKRLDQRQDHMPLSYIRGKREFYGRDFIITNDVLEPRPESESIIELLKKISLPPAPSIADVGAGSGALGITASLEIPGACIDLIEVDPGAIGISRKNAALHNAQVNCIENDLLPSPHPKYDVIIANLPYVPDNFPVNKAAAHEPRLAIFGGPDGLELYRRLFEQLLQSPDKPFHLLVESMLFQHPALENIARESGYEVHAEDGFAQHFILKKTV